MSDAQKDYAVVCEHGGLKRKCEICELREELADALKWNDRHEDENEKLQDELAAAIAERDAALEKAKEWEPRLIAFENGEIKLSVARVAMQNLVAAFKELNKDAINYTETQFRDKEDGREFIVTVQNKGAKSPHELRIEAERERDDARKCLREAHECVVTEVRIGPQMLARWRKAAGMEESK